MTLPETDSGTVLDSDSQRDGYIVLCRTCSVHIAQIRTWIPIPCFCIGQESESEYVPESVSGNVIEL